RLTGVRGQQARQHADGGGLAGAVFAEQGEDGAARHSERQAIHGPRGAEALAQIDCFYDGFHVRFSGGGGGEPLTSANSSSTSRRISSLDRALPAASRSAVRMRLRTNSWRRARQAAGASAVTSIPRPRRDVTTPARSNS